MSSRILTIVFTDIKGFTERTAKMEREAVTKLLARQDELLKPIMRHYEGTLVKSIGDAYLITFQSPTNAVLCGVLMQHALRRHNATVWPEERIEIRVAINTGEVSLVEGDVIGDPVNVASRLEGITDANEVWFTEATYLAMNKREVPTSRVGEFRLKGIDEPVRVYRVLQDENLELYRKIVTTQQNPAVKAISIVDGPRRKPVWAAVLGVLIVGFVLGALLWPGPRSALGEIRKQVDQGMYPQALFALEKALQTDPSNLEAQELVRRAVDAEVLKHVQAAQPDDARKVLDDFLKRFPFLGLAPHLDREIRFAHLEQVRRKNYKEAAKIVEQILEKYGTEPETVYRAGKYYSEVGFDTRLTILTMQKAVQLDPARKDDPVAVAAFRYFLEYYGPSDGYDSVREWIAKNYGERFLPDLKENLYTAERAEFRWNCYTLLRARQEPVDEFKFHLTQLLDPKSGEDGYTKKSTDYMVQRVLEGPAQEALNKVPRSIVQFPPLDRRFYKLDEDVMRVVDKLLFESMKSYLNDALTDGKNTHRRVNAFRLLSARGLAPEQALPYHSTNLLHWDEQYQPAHVFESMDFFERLPEGIRPAGDVTESLKEIVARSEQYAKEAAERKYHDRAKEWVKFGEAAKRALARLSGER
jgi:class 3 adenylate cyclase